MSLEQSISDPTEYEVPIADDGGAGGNNNDENESLPQSDMDDQSVEDLQGPVDKASKNEQYGE
jgi:hypothetical protein